MSKSSAKGLAVLLATQNPLGFVVADDISKNWNAFESESAPQNPNVNDIWIKKIPIFTHPNRYITAVKIDSTNIGVYDSADSITWNLVVTIPNIPSSSGASISVLSMESSGNIFILASSANALVENLMWILDGNTHSIILGPIKNIPSPRDSYFWCKGDTSYMIPWDNATSPYGTKSMFAEGNGIKMSSTIYGTSPSDFVWSSGVTRVPAAWNPNTKLYAYRAASTQMVFEIDEDGNTYSKPTFPPSGQGSRGGLAYSPKHNRYITFERPALYYSSDLNSWTAGSNPSMGNYVQGFKWLPINDMFLARDAGGLFSKSIDGTVFTSLTTLGSSQETLFIKEDSNGNIFHGSTLGLHRSSDGGLSWQQVAIPSITSATIRTLDEACASYRREIYIYNGITWDKYR